VQGMGGRGGVPRHSTNASDMCGWQARHSTQKYSLVLHWLLGFRQPGVHWVHRAHSMPAHHHSLPAGIPLLIASSCTCLMGQPQALTWPSSR
jgi:hypothetical protein